MLKKYFFNFALLALFVFNLITINGLYIVRNFDENDILPNQKIQELNFLPRNFEFEDQPILVQAFDGENNDQTEENRKAIDKVVALNLLTNGVLQTATVESQTQKNLITDVNKLKTNTNAKIKALENIKAELESNIATEIVKDSINKYNEEIEKAEQQSLKNQIESTIANDLAETKNERIESEIKKKKKNLLADELDYLDRANSLKNLLKAKQTINEQKAADKAEQFFVSLETFLPENQILSDENDSSIDIKPYDLNKTNNSNNDKNYSKFYNISKIKRIIAVDKTDYNQNPNIYLTSDSIMPFYYLITPSLS